MNDKSRTEILEFRCKRSSKIFAYIAGPLLYALAIYVMIKLYRTKPGAIFLGITLIIAVTIGIIQVIISKIKISEDYIEVIGFRSKRVYFRNIRRYIYDGSVIYIHSSDNYVSIMGLNEYEDWKQIIIVPINRIRQINPQAEIKVPKKFQ